MKTKKTQKFHSIRAM